MNRTEKYQSVLTQLRLLIKKDYGKRCELKDTEDFPELEGQKEGRCPNCIVYEYTDELEAELDLDNI